MTVNRATLSDRDRHYPANFVDAITSHLMETRAAAYDPRNHPGLLVIQGPAGSGKSSGIRYITERLGASFREIHGKDMAAPYEGEAVLPLQEAYITASQEDATVLKAFNIDDADMGNLRVDKKYTGTNNSHHVTAFLMRLVDDPFHMIIEHEAVLGKPKPAATELNFRDPPALFMTVNNTDVLHLPLVREGRARLVTLDPQGYDLERAVAGMYPSLSEKQARKLVRKFPEKSVAFFAELGKTAARGIALQRAQACGYRFGGFDWQGFSHDLSAAGTGATFEVLLVAANQLAGRHQRRNFLSADYASTRKKPRFSFPAAPNWKQPTIPPAKLEAL